jgi:hypothetical protein
MNASLRQLGCGLNAAALTLFIALLALTTSECTAAQTEDVTATATWDMPDAAAVRRGVFAYLAGKQPSAETKSAAELAWPEAAKPAGGELLDRVAAVLGLADPQARDVAAYAGGAGSVEVIPHQAWLTAAATPPIVSANLRLLAARRLIEGHRYDDVIQLLAGVEVDRVADPAALLFDRAVALHGLVRPQDCVEAAALLLENEAKIPVRYAKLAHLLRADIEKVQDGTLDHIARRMDDVGRRLEVGEADPKVNELADGVVKALDDLIKKAEQQRQQQNSGSGSAAPRPSEPARQSDIAEGKGEGKVEHKSIGSGRGWGSLPAKLREQALQQIGKDFPAHYREIIEEYFRRLAAEDGE